MHKILAEKCLSCKILTKGKEFVPVELQFNCLIKSNLPKFFFSGNYFQYNCLVDLIKDHEKFLEKYEMVVDKKLLDMMIY